MSKALVMGVIALVLVAFLVSPVAATTTQEQMGIYTNKYVATQTDYPTTGSVSGSVRCHNNLLTTGITYTSPSGVVTPVDLRPDGTFDINNLTPGQYVMNIDDGNGGQPESAAFTIRAGQVSFLESELLGHAVSPADEPAKLDTITVLRALYGMQVTVIDVAYVEGTPAVPAVTHTEPRMVSPGSPATPDTYTYAGHNRGDYDKVTHHGQTTYDYVGHNNGDYDKVCGHPAIPPTFETVTVIDVPAVPAVPAVEEVSHLEGSYIDVTSQVQQAIDGGAREFKFNNAMNPGGIVNVAQDTVLVAINDPAPGIVKSIRMTWTVNGEAKTLDTMEYETINI